MPTLKPCSDQVANRACVGPSRVCHPTSGVTPALHYLTLSDPFEPARPRHLAHYEWGDAANPHVAICAHGLSRNGRDFDHLAKALSPHFRVLCPDMAGRGKSDWLVNKADYSYSLYTSDCLALLHQLKLERVTWIGTSIGGIIGMMIAAAQKQAYIRAGVQRHRRGSLRRGPQAHTALCRHRQRLL